MKVIFLGTGSGAGKTTVTAMYCRYLYMNGVKITPFKASNLSLNSYVTKDGKEIGMGQAFQALVANIDATAKMNPILLKPTGKGSLQLILEGEPYCDIKRDDPEIDKMIRERALACFDSLSKEYEAVVCEGSGSPAEINLLDRDIANVGMMRARQIPAILVGDIERGGVFAALYGTWKLIPDDVKPLMKGFIINRFRGDSSILKKGTDRIEELTGMKFLGTIPYSRLKFPEEDSLSDTEGKMEGKDARTAFLNNIDELLENAVESELDFDSMDDISSA